MINYSKLTKKIEDLAWVTLGHIPKKKDPIYFPTKKGLEVYSNACFFLNERSLFKGPNAVGSLMSINFFLNDDKNKFIINLDSVNSDGSIIKSLSSEGYELLKVFVECIGKQKGWNEKSSNGVSLEKKIGKISIKFINAVNQVGKMSGQMSDAMSKMGSSFDYTSNNKNNKNSFTDDYSKLGNLMIGNKSKDKPKKKTRKGGKKKWARKNRG
jgi:hypothetical protein